MKCFPCIGQRFSEEALVEDIMNRLESRADHYVGIMNRQQSQGVGLDEALVDDMAKVMIVLVDDVAKVIESSYTKYRRHEDFEDGYFDIA